MVHQELVWFNLDYNQWIVAKNRGNPNVKSLKLHLSTLCPRKNGWHFAVDIFKFIFLYENLIQIWLNFVLKYPINSEPLLVQIMAWRQTDFSNWDFFSLTFWNFVVDQLSPVIKSMFNLLHYLGEWTISLLTFVSKFESYGPFFYSNSIPVNYIITNFSHDMTAMLLCHVQNFVVIICKKLGWEQNKFCIECELCWRVDCKMGFRLGHIEVELPKCCNGHSPKWYHPNKFS